MLVNLDEEAVSKYTARPSVCIPSNTRSNYRHGTMGVDQMEGLCCDGTKM